MADDSSYYVDDAYDAPYYVEPDTMSDTEYMYNYTLNPPNTRSSIETSIESEYVYDEEDEYVLSSHDMNEVSNPSQNIALEDKRPTHKKNEEGVYDGVDYELSPRVTKDTGLGDIQKDEKVEKEEQKRWLRLSKKTIIILSFVGVCLIVAIVAGIICSLPGTSFDVICCIK